MDQALQFVVRILQVGFSGFAFLMALMSFRLLRMEMRRRSVRDAILRNVRWYMKWAFGLAVLVGLMSTTEIVLSHTLGSSPLTEHGEQISECESRLVVLESMSIQEGVTGEDMQAAISGYASMCRPLLEQLKPE